MKSAPISGATHDAVCTPLVIDSIGTSWVGQLRPEALPHLARDLAVQLAHAVVVVRRVDREHGHRERRALVVRVDAPEAEQLALGDAERRAVRLEVLAHEVGREGVVAGGDRRVRREDVAGAVGLGGDVEATRRARA